MKNTPQSPKWNCNRSIETCPRWLKSLTHWVDLNSPSLRNKIVLERGHLSLLNASFFMTLMSSLSLRSGMETGWGHHAGIPNPPSSTTITATTTINIIPSRPSHLPPTDCSIIHGTLTLCTGNRVMRIQYEEAMKFERVFSGPVLSASKRLASAWSSSVCCQCKRKLVSFKYVAIKKISCEMHSFSTQAWGDRSTRRKRLKLGVTWDTRGI